MKKVTLIILALMMSLCLSAQQSRKNATRQKGKKVQKTQNVDQKYATLLATYLNGSNYITQYNLTSSQLRKTVYNTFTDKRSNADFDKALNAYFPTIYEKSLPEVLTPYFSKYITTNQLDSLIQYNKSEKLHQTKVDIEKCNNAQYRDKKVDEALSAIAQKSGKKKIKKNMKKFVSDCTPEYRAAVNRYATLTNSGKLKEDMVNAIYHTVTMNDLTTYNMYLQSGALVAKNDMDASMKEEKYDIINALVANFQTWTYKAYPSLFTTKQTKSKNQKGKKGAKTTQDNDAIIEGGILIPGN